MPEPTDVPEGYKTIEQACADLDQYGSELTHADAPYNPAALAVVSAAGVLRAACEQQAHDLDVQTASVFNWLGRAREAEARAAAAEAAVQRVREVAKVGHDRCVYRPHAIEDEYERGKAHALDDMYRLVNGAPTPQPDLTSVSGIVNAAPDDQPVTVTGYIHHVEALANRSSGLYVELVLVDRDAELEDADPSSVKVEVPASVYAAMDLALRPREGTLVEVVGRTVRKVVVIASGVRELTCSGHLGSDPEGPEYCDGTCRPVGGQS